MPKKPITKNCLECTESFVDKDGRGKFCSRSCAAKYNNKNRASPSEEQRAKISQGLKKYYKTNPQSIERRKNTSKGVGNVTKGKFKGEISSILEASSRTVRKILARLGLPCSRCGWNEGVCDIHHINGRKIENADSHNNLAYICPNCHRLIHEGKVNKEEIKTLEEYFPNDWRKLYYG